MARGGSKGIPRKNVCLVGGKPLIAWTIEAALASRSVQRVILSTDDEEIAETARLYGCEVPFLRPAELARDESSGFDVCEHALRWIEASGDHCDYLLVLQPTSPLRIVQIVARLRVTGSFACLWTPLPRCTTSTRSPPSITSSISTL